jgi:hypothetical protein
LTVTVNCVNALCRKLAEPAVTVVVVTTVGAVTTTRTDEVEAAKLPLPA